MIQINIFWNFILNYEKKPVSPGCIAGSVLKIILIKKIDGLFPGLEMTRQVRCRIEGDHIIPPAGMELIIVDHCNIACRQCNHGSPVIPKWNADPSDVARDLGILSKVFKPAFLKLIGGEPLLHPNLPEVIRAARNSGITNHFLLVTNGILLDRASDDLWSLIDEIEISGYEASALSEDLLSRAMRRAEEHGVSFTLNHFSDFRRTFTVRRTENDELVGKIFRACKIANVWGCYALYKGRIYRCPQSMYVPALAGIDVTEGIAVNDSATFRDELFAFLTSTEPLMSCRYCVGTAGRKQPHKLLPRSNWRMDLEEPAEEMIDWDLLNRLLEEIVPIDDCKTPVKRIRKQDVNSLLHWPMVRKAANQIWRGWR
ncbi:MAG TPA: hypothetical protein VIH22_07265 [Cyclobacteriaceae bacterium]|nr:MAG: hypothetical protein A2993_07270 [Gammaproteobacteria bacterium RIFCSPLOWO2_01_FULL_47_190]OGT84663.1 MAG: hypothetical protein A3G42_04630 [Gammaproteobacteria bacterium RIFCSPLOWO2_12_FULL_47_76]